MIRLDLGGSPSAAERWAFELLVDLSRLLPIDKACPGGVRAILIDSAPGEPPFAASADAVRVSRAALRTVVDTAGAGVEQRSGARDRHGRVPSSENPLVRQRAERELPVQRAADALLSAVRVSAGSAPLFRVGGWPDQKGWAAAFTHDLDIVSGWPLFAGLRWAELFRKGEMSLAGSAITAGLGALGSDPVAKAIESILRSEQDAGIRSTWFVMAGIPTFASWRRGDVTYRLDAPPARRLIERIIGGGHEVGLHGSFATRDSADLMAIERERVARISGSRPEGVRQHFLRFDPSQTPAGAAKAGFLYDATFGFADRNGFRLGVADVVPTWQDSSGKSLSLLEAPLVWMDRTYSKYRGEEDPCRWVEDAMQLAATCREAGGLWTGLWHPNVVPSLGFPGALEAFDSLIRQVAGYSPYLAPLAEIVRWRNARRALRGRIGAGGTLELVSDRPGTWGVTIEDLAAGDRGLHSWPEPRRG
jgi:peptidoglycan/xylan/chitin deacetylase (PgdA/CDA1 family)